MAMPDYLQYFALWTVVSAALMYMDKKNAARYAALGAFAVLAALFAEILSFHAFPGLWTYNVGPFLFGVNVFTIANYFNYMIVAYFLSERLRRWFQ